MHKVQTNYRFWVFFIGILFLFSGCTVSKKRKYQREYRRLWKEIIQSQAWKDALRSSKTFSYVDSELRYVAVGPSQLSTVILPDSERTREVFEPVYKRWLNQAYYRIIAEAEKADEGIKKDYEALIAKRREPEFRGDPEFRESLHLARRRYQAHRNMLEGLKSWKVFEEYSTDDLEFFGAENKKLTYELFRTAQDEETILAFLMYKLADLYHQEH